MDSVCRTCLTLGDLLPIFTNRKQHSIYTSVLLMTTGLKIELNDGLPQSICQGCTNLINSALKLRDQSHHAQQILLENGFQKVARLRATGERTVAVLNDATADTENDELPQKNKVVEKNGNEIICKKEIKIEIDLNYPPSFFDLNNSDNFIIKTETKSQTDSVNVDAKDNVKRKPTIKRPKPEETTAGDRISDDRSCLSADAEVKLNVGTNESCTVKAKRKYARKKIDRPENRETESKRRKESTAISEPDRGEAKPKKIRLTPKQTVEKFQHAMESKYVPKQPVKCRVCKKEFAGLTTFVPHVKKHFIGEYVCEQCGRRFHTNRELRDHGMRHHGAERNLRCPHCEFRAIDQYQLKGHIHKIHTGLRPYVCDVCGADFFSKPIIRQHMRKHSTVRNVQCDRCPAMFKSTSRLSGHMALSHRMNYSYLCYLCPRRYNGRSSVRKHLTRQHGVPRQQQGPLTMRKWAKDQPPPPDLV